MSAPVRPAGINFLGYASASIGLGQVVRQFASTLIDRGHAVAIFDVDAGHGRSGKDLSLQRHFVPTADALPHDINIWVIGASDLNHWALTLCNNAALQRKFNAAFVWWELPDLPPRWCVGAQAFDALIAGSEFVRETLSCQVAPVPVILAKHPLSVPAGVVPDRSRFGLPDDGLLVYTGFEPRSDTERKNPFAAVQAFQRAFADNPAARLVIKLNHPEQLGGKAQLLLDRLYSMIGSDARCHLITEHLPYRELLALYASCDVFMSLHRSEGLGLMPMEAMRLRKPVVATGWSGNMTYMRHGNAALVNFKLVPTTEAASAYSPSQLGVTSRWAEPDIDHAAAWLKTLATNAELRTEYGRCAERDSVAYDAEARKAPFVDELLAMARTRTLTPAVNYGDLKRRIVLLERDERYRQFGRTERMLRRSYDAVHGTLERHLLWRLNGHRS